MKFLKELFAALKWASEAQKAAEEYHGAKSGWASYVWKKAGEA